MSKFTKQLPNARAARVVSSWLTACDIPHNIDNQNLITIQGVTGPVKVNLTTSNEAASDAMNVPAADLLTKDIPVAIKTFQKITEAAGYGSPVPVDRGEAPAKKLNYKKAEEFELVAFRHREFRAAPNPPDKEMLRYKRIYEGFAQAFYKKNSGLCNLMGYTADDIATYCRVWTVNFIHKYAVHNPTEDDNEKLLVCHLKQRLPELASLLKRKAGNVKGVPEYLEMVEEARDAEEPDSDWLDRNQTIHNKSYASRRKEAASLLEQELSKLPHDEMVFLLRNAAENKAIEHDASREAAKRLKVHLAGCQACGAGSSSNT